MNYLHQLEKILETRFKLATMETYDTDRVIDLFTQLSRFSNKAFYMHLPGKAYTDSAPLTSHSPIPGRRWRS